MKEKNTYKILDFILYLISSYGIVILGIINVLIHVNFLELIKDKGVGLILVSFIPGVSILLLGIIELIRRYKKQISNIIFSNRFNIQFLLTSLVIALSLAGIVITAVLSKSWELKNYILFISLFILGLNRLVLEITNKIPVGMISGVMIVLITGLFHCLSGIIFLLTGLGLLILGICDLRVIKIKITEDVLACWIFFTSLLLIGIFIINLGIEKSQFRIDWETILFGIGLIPFSILFFLFIEKIKEQTIRKTKTKLLSLRLIFQIISFIFIGLGVYVILASSISTHVGHEIIQEMKKLEVIDAIGLITSIIGSILFLLGAMIGIKTYTSLLGIFIFGLSGIIYVYLIIINLGLLSLLLALPLFVCFLSIWVFLKKDKIPIRGKYPLVFIQYYEFKTMDEAIDDVIKKISKTPPNVNKIVMCKKMLKKHKKLSQNLLFAPYISRLEYKTKDLERYINNHLSKVRNGKYPSYYLKGIRNGRFGNDDIRILKNILDQYTFEYECIIKLKNNQVALVIHGVTNILEEQYRDSYFNPSGYYPELKKGKYPQQSDEVIINLLSHYFDKSKNYYYFYLKNVFSCPKEEVNAEIILLGKRYKIVGISDKLTNYRDIYLSYFEAKNLTERVDLRKYKITEQDAIFAIFNTLEELQKVKEILEKMELFCFEGMID